MKLRLTNFNSNTYEDTDDAWHTALNAILWSTEEELNEALSWALAA